MTRKSTLQSITELALRQRGQLVTVFKKSTRVAAGKGSYRTGTGKLKMVKNRENWYL